MAFGNQLHRLRYFFADAWDEWRHSLAANITALGTLVSALFLAGLVMLIVSNLERRVLALRNDVRVEIYLLDDHTAEARQELVRRLEAHAGVERVAYVDKDEALRRYRAWAAGLAELVNELETNPLPASLEVHLRADSDLAGVAQELAASLRGQPGVEEVRFNRDWLSRLEALLDLARTAGTTVVVLVFVAVVFVMGSVLRLAVLARQEEIEIMQLVGATPAFIRGPYLVAGALQGLLAATLALVLVEAVRRAGQAAGEALPAGMLLDLVAARPLTPETAGLLALAGLLVGIAGSYISVRQSV
jgi:cell division transport system permease protein